MALGAILAQLAVSSLPSGCLLGPATCETIRLNELEAKMRCERYDRDAHLLDSTCRQGHAEDCLELGNLIVSCESQPAESERYHLLACALGTPAGCMRVGDRASNEAARNVWYQRAAEIYESWCTAGDPVACSAVAGWIYDGMYGLERDMPRAAELLANACLAGLTGVCFRAAHLFASGPGPIDVDEKRAKELERLGCESQPTFPRCPAPHRASLRRRRAPPR
jgi:TPR repeat protein